ncbi:MAG TPA: ring-opening amidohydrolase, partial [Bradyrhizobium sp.]
MTRRAFVHRISTLTPDDVAGLEAAFDAGRIQPEAVVAIFGKTEGNGCVNDWTRALAARALRDLLERRLGAAAAAVCVVMSGGTEGALAPHLTVFEIRHSDDAPHDEALAIGHAHTAHLAPEDLGRLAQVDLVAEAVRRAMAEAAISDPAEVHLVQVKCPLLTPERIREAGSRCAACATQDPL